jgi:hypothetical protein
MTDDVAPPGHVRLIAGTFQIFTNETGDYILIADVEGQGRQVKRLPAAMAKALQGNGPMGKLFAKTFGGNPPISESAGG